MTNKKNMMIHGETYTLVWDFKDDPELRAGFNALTQRVFQFDFEQWYQAGYWKQAYCPFSLMKDGRFIANVSANDLTFRINGDEKKAIQIGTVMTDPAFRNRGLSRALMETVLQEYEGKTDFQYLFANDEVLDFYPKFGFRTATETQCKSRVKRQVESPEVRQLNLDVPEDLDLLMRIGETKAANAQLAMVGNFELNMFYCGFFLREYLYYIPALDAVAVAIRKADKLFIQEVFADQLVDLQTVIQALMTEAEMEVSLGFSPIDAAGFELVPYEEEDRTLFLRGVQIGQAMFPLLAQA